MNKQKKNTEVGGGKLQLNRMESIDDFDLIWLLQNSSSSFQFRLLGKCRTMKIIDPVEVVALRHDLY